MAHDFKFDKQKISRIGDLLPRLGYSVTPLRVSEWLENFEDHEVDLLIDLLSVLEYISFNELQARIEFLLKGLFKGIPKEDEIFIIPYGKPGKSGSLISYPVEKTSSFQQRKKYIKIENDHYKLTPKVKHVILIDDFVGSGKTFIDEYCDIKDIKSKVDYCKIKNVYLMAPVVMSQAYIKIKNRFPEVEIICERRNKIFDTKNSPFNLFKNRSSLKTLSYKYGKAIRESPYGYGGAESLISFFYGTPNNTLPIIWSDKNKWKPIFPRKVHSKIEEVKNIKKNIAYSIGIYNRLGIDIYNQNESIFVDTSTNRRREIKYNSKLHHSVIGLIWLKKQKYDDILICQILGLTMDDLSGVYAEAIKLGLIHKSKSLTTEGTHFLKKIYKRVRKEGIRKESKKNLTPSNNLYLPSQFNGKA